MCGRYKITKPVSKTVDLVKTNIKVEDNENFNAHPTQKLPIIKSYTKSNLIQTVRHLNYVCGDLCLADQKNWINFHH